nr:zinc ribbon domain-containing protein [uncultured Bacteroides sp.]
MITCPNCSKQIDDNDKLIFCPYCLTQIICKQCKEPLSKGAVGCIVCGTPLISKVSDSGQINEIEFERKGDSVKFKTKFTDNVGKELVSTFGSIAGVNQFTKRTFLSNTALLKNQQNITQNGELPYVDAEELPIDDSEISQALNLIFTLDGDKLIFQKNSFKEQNKLDKEIRISLLLLLGYKYLLNTNDLKRQTLTDILKHRQLNTGGFRNWIVKSDEIGRKGKGIIFLTPDGKDKAIEILNEVIDKNITKGNISFSKTTVTSRRKSSNGNTDSTKKSSAGATSYIKNLIDDGYFKERRLLGEIAQYLKDKRAISFTTAEIGVPIAKLLTPNGLEREKGNSGQYEYFVR